MAKFVVDPMHSEMEFQVRHMMVTKVKGTFENYSIEIDVDNIENFEEAKVTAEADTASINTGVGDRDDHLRSGDFFNAEQNEKITFKSTDIEKSGSTFKVTGDLNMNGVTNQETIELDYNGQGVDPMSGDNVYGFEGKFEINREDYGLNWNANLETGGVLVSKEVKLNLEFQFREAE